MGYHDAEDSIDGIPSVTRRPVAQRFNAAMATTNPRDANSVGDRL
jgi:hypothetical protein